MVMSDEYHTPPFQLPEIYWGKYSSIKMHRIMKMYDVDVFEESLDLIQIVVEYEVLRIDVPARQIDQSNINIGMPTRCIGD